MRVPLFEAGRAQARRAEGDALLQRRRAELEDIKVRSTSTCAPRCSTCAPPRNSSRRPQTTVTLANQELEQARDRFAAGVASNIEVTQAQEAVAAASETYLSALYAHNLAKASLARAVGRRGNRNHAVSRRSAVMADEATAAAAAPATGRRKLPMIVGGVVLLALIAGVWMWLSSGKESTDDAQVEGHITQLATRVGGTVVKVLVTDNQYVEAGTVVAEIDPRDYQVAVDRARAELADAEATATAAGTGIPIAEVSTRSDVSQATGGVEETQAGIAVADSQVEAARAQLVAVQARLREREATATKTAQDVERLKPLVAKEEIAQQQFDAAVAAADAARAAADAAKSDIASAQTAIAVAQQRAVQARAGAAQARATLQTARTAPQQMQATRARHASAEAKRAADARRARSGRAQSRARRRSRRPSAGTVSRKTVEVGAVVQPGQPLMALVSRADVWVVANFKETQLAEMRDGQQATHRGGCARRPHLHRPRRQPVGRDRGHVQPAAAGERDRQLRQGRAARAGQDRARPGPGSRNTGCGPACRCSRRFT